MPLKVTNLTYINRGNATEKRSLYPTHKMSRSSRFRMTRSMTNSRIRKKKQNQVLRNKQWESRSHWSSTRFESSWRWREFSTTTGRTRSTSSNCGCGWSYACYKRKFFNLTTGRRVVVGMVAVLVLAGVAIAIAVGVSRSNSAVKTLYMTLLPAKPDAVKTWQHCPQNLWLFYKTKSWML